MRDQINSEATAPPSAGHQMTGALGNDSYARNRLINYDARTGGEQVSETEQKKSAEYNAKSLSYDLTFQSVLLPKPVVFLTAVHLRSKCILK